MFKKSFSPSVPLLMGALSLLSTPLSHAASCCGGGSSSALIIPKAGTGLYAASLDIERYNGVWRSNGDWVADADDYDLYQYRLNMGYAKRLAKDWQASVNLPWVYNSNHYGGISRDTQGLGDMTLSLLYETFETITCAYQVNSIKDLKPAVYLGTSLTLPTGISPYDNVGDNFDITGRGFYRLDGTVLMEKTVFPWNVSLQYSLGYYFERPVNREYGRYVEPYNKQLGLRTTTSVSFGRTWQAKDWSSWTGTLAYADMKEEQSEIDGVADPTSAIRKRSLTATVAWSNPNKKWIVKGSWNHSLQWDDWGYNFPTTDILSGGVTYVF